MDCVVGSGPAGVACATALLKRGRTVLMLDAGIRLEADRAKVAQSLASSPPEQWRPTERQWLRDGMDPSAKGIPSKLLFGSNYPYQDTERELGAEYGDVGLRASLALGGLSTVWGAAMLPYMDRDIADWPITTAQLAPHYRAAVGLTGLSAVRDGLEKLLPLYTDTPGRLEASRQAVLFLRKLDWNLEKLSAAGIHYGQSRLAIQAAREPGTPGCVYCGMCVYGCPYGYIYNSAATVAKLQREEKFTYQSDVIVETVAESGDEVIVRGHRRTTHEPVELKVSRVYLAAGAIPTTGILLRSLSARDRTVRMKDSQYFLLPMLFNKPVSDVETAALHTLSQAFIEILDPKISPHAVHLQVYTYNDLMGKAVRKSMRGLARPLEFVARGLEKRLLLFQGFIHSAHSSEIAVTLRSQPDGRPEKLHLEPVINPEAARVVQRVVRKLLKHSFQLGVVPLLPMLQVTQPGRSFHSGGTFPMREKPTRFETDTLGRPAGWQRVHAVDATVFPSIAATTITMTVMANAHRIGTETADLP